MWPENLMEDLNNNRAPPLYYVNLCASFQRHRRIQTEVTVRKCSIWVQIFLPPVTSKFEMTLKNNRVNLLSCLNLCASFDSYISIQNGVTVRKRQIWVKIGDFFPCDLAIWHMTLKNNRALLLCSFNHCVSFHSLLWNQNKVTVRKHQIWVKICDFFVPCDLEIWQMSLKSNRAPLLYYLKLSASFHSHLWIQNGVTVTKCSIWVKIGDFLSYVTVKFDEWPWKTTGHLFYATSSFVHHLIAICEFKKELQSGNAKFGSKSAIFLPMWSWNLTSDFEKQ